MDKVNVKWQAATPLSEFRPSRRGFLAGASAVGLGLALGGCSSQSSSPASHAPSGKIGSALAGGTPKRGGTLTVGVTGSGNAETLFPGGAQVYSDYFRAYSLYDMLFYPGTGVTPIEPALAISAEANADATVWTFKLRDGVEWHDGKPFTSQDVVYNFQHVWPDAKVNLGAALLTGLIDTANVKAIDKLTVQVPLHRPVAEFPTLLVYVNNHVVQDGATPQSVAAHAVGTGPFKFASFTPGRQSVFDANPNYWQEGKPYVDKLVINSSFTDPNALVNALLGGQINVLPAIDPVAARQQMASGKIQVIQSALPANVPLISMRVDKGPFVDNRVRQAFKLLCDRQALIDGALNGFGVPGNDLISVGSKYFADDVKPQHDPDKARALLRDAGVAGTTYSLQTFQGGGPWDAAATLFAQQAKAAGINVEAKVTSGETYFTPAGGVYTGYFRQNISGPIAVSMTASYRLFLSQTSPFPDTHWAQQAGGQKYEDLLSNAIATQDEAKAAELWREVQMAQVEQGGYIGWANMPYVDAAASNVRGLTTGAAMSFNNFRMCDGWID